MHPFTWAIVGPGAIAHRFADAVHRMPDTEVAIVCGRDQARANAFARHWCRDGHAVASCTSLDELLDNPSIDGIYVATPHSHHAAPVLHALNSGKAVLCEKALAPSAGTAVPLVAAASKHGCFLMEALWTRFLPVYATVGDWLRSGRIGALRGIQSSFCFNVPFTAESRLFAPELAGGCLLDIGIYNLSMSRWVIAQTLGDCPEPVHIDCHGRLAPTGVEQHVSAHLQFAGGIAVQFICGFDCRADNSMQIIGERGHITLPGGFWEATRATLHVNGVQTEVIDAPFSINGFEYEIAEAIHCARAGLIESPTMQHGETLITLRWMDHMRAALGAELPFN